MTSSNLPHASARANELFAEHLRAVHVRTDRLFGWLLPVQWLAAIAAAMWITPLTWSGSVSDIHAHVWAAIFLGGLIVAFPVGLARWCPGWTITRHGVAVAQMLMGGLLIHLTGGRLETHFHVFGSLAFLAFYRDWRVIVTATVVVAADHFVRGLFFPASVFGVETASSWRWLEHAGWVLFEDCFLIQACRHGIRELHAISERQAELEHTNATIENIVAERTTQLQEQQDHTAQIIETANDAFVDMDEKGLITDWNRQAEAIYGWSRKEVLGRPLIDIVVPEQYREAFIHGMEEFRVSGQAFFINRRVEAAGLHRDGRQFPIEMTVWPISRGETTHFSAFIHDITDRKRVEAELQRTKEIAESANRAKSEFLANMSHEIRTPMNGIMGMTRLALGTELTPLQREYLDMVARSADALLDIINDILDFSKIEAGKLTLDPMPFSLRDCIEDLLKDLSVRAQAKNLELSYHLGADVPDGLIGDPGRLRQVLINLVGNAIKFTEKGEVTVHVSGSKTADDAARLHFAIRDTGIGIAPEKVAAIFRPFEQADNGTTRRYGGTGLGLTISNKLVAMMGGAIGVDSRLGSGSTFHFEAGFGLTHEAVQRKPVMPIPNLHGLSVLVVDDNETNRRMLNDLLLSWKMRPRLTAGGPEALWALNEAATKRQPYSLVILDAMMPEMDGFAVAEFIHTHPEFARATVMMLSSADRQEDASRCRRLGVESYLAKPVTQSDLFDAIVDSLQLHASKLPAVPASRTAEIVPTTGLRGLHILLAEDNLINQRLAVKVLELMGHHVTTALNGQEALDASARQNFDLVLMDVQMPELDGLEATRAIRERERETGLHLPIVAMTAHALKGDRERCLEAGMDGYVPKPIDPHGLANEIAVVLAVQLPVAAKSAAAPAADGVLDLRRLENLRGMAADGELLHELIDMFHQECPRMLNDVRYAIDQRDATAVNRKAHLLKGSLLSLGALRATDEAQQVEQLGKKGLLVEAATRFTDLAREIERFRTALNGYCSRKAK